MEDIERKIREKFKGCNNYGKPIQSPFFREVKKKSFIEIIKTMF